MGQSTVSATYCCLKTEQMLENITGLAPNLLELETWGTANAIIDSQSEGITQAIQTPSAFGKAKPTATNRVVDVKYHVPTCPAANVNITFDCSDESASAETYAYDRASVDDYVGYKFSIDADDYDDICENLEGELAIKLREAYRALYKQFNDELAVKLAAKAGNYFALASETPVASLTNPESLKIVTAGAPILPQPMGWFPVANQYERMGVMGQSVYGVGGNDLLRAYQFAQPIMAGNTDGNDPAKKSSGVKDYFDPLFDSLNSAIAGTKRFVTWAAGSIALLEWYRFEGDKIVTPGGRNIFAPAQHSGTLVRQKIDLGSVFTPRSFVVDMQIEYRECDNEVVYKFRKDYDLWNIPEAAFITACHQQHNYILLWDVACGDFTCSDAEYPVTPAE